MSFWTKYILLLFKHDKYANERSSAAMDESYILCMSKTGMLPSVSRGLINNSNSLVFVVTNYP